MLLKERERERSWCMIAIIYGCYECVRVCERLIHVDRGASGAIACADRRCFAKCIINLVCKVWFWARVLKAGGAIVSPAHACCMPNTYIYIYQYMITAESCQSSFHSEISHDFWTSVYHLCLNSRAPKNSFEHYIRF